MPTWQGTEHNSRGPWPAGPHTSRRARPPRGPAVLTRAPQVDITDSESSPTLWCAIPGAADPSAPASHPPTKSHLERPSHRPPVNTVILVLPAFWCQSGTVGWRGHRRPPAVRLPGEQTSGAKSAVVASGPAEAPRSTSSRQLITSSDSIGPDHRDDGSGLPRTSPETAQHSHPLPETGLPHGPTVSISNPEPWSSKYHALPRPAAEQLKPGPMPPNRIGLDKFPAHAPRPRPGPTGPSPASTPQLATARHRPAHLARCAAPTGAGTRRPTPTGSPNRLTLTPTGGEHTEPGDNRSLSPASVSSPSDVVPACAHTRLSFRTQCPRGMPRHDSSTFRLTFAMRANSFPALGPTR